MCHFQVAIKRGSVPSPFNRFLKPTIFYEVENSSFAAEKQHYSLTLDYF